MKLSFWQRVLMWLVEQIAPKLIAAALAKIKVAEIVASIRPFISRVVGKIPQGFKPQLRELLVKVGDFFTKLAAEIE